MMNRKENNRKNNERKTKGGLRSILALALALAMIISSALPAFATGGSIYDLFNPGSGNSAKDSADVTETEEDGDNTTQNNHYYDSVEDTSDDTIWDYFDSEEFEAIDSEEEYTEGGEEYVEEVYEETTEEIVEETEEEEVTEEAPALPVVTLSDKPEDRGRNVLGLAAAYIGWGESLHEYREYADGTVVGSTIFGETFGDAYRPWNVSFVSYILQQAGIGDLPQSVSIEELVAELKDSKYAGRLASPADYEPVEGDLVLLGLPGKTISEINPAGTIEKLAELDASAYNNAGAGVAAGLINAAAVASANQQDDRNEAIYTRVAVVKAIGEKPVRDAEGKEVKDASGRVIRHNFLTVIEGDVEDPAVAGNTEIDAQYRMTGTVQEVDYDLDEMTLTYEDIAGLSAEELDELKTTSPQVLDYIILMKNEAPAPEPTPTPAPTPAPEKIEDVSADAIDSNSIGAGAMLGLMVKPKAEHVSSEEALAALENTDLSSLRLIIGTENEEIFAADSRVVAGYNGIYLLQAETEEELKTAFLTYYDKADFVAPDTALAIAADDEDPAEEVLTTDNVYTEEENPFAELEAALEDVPKAPKRNVRRIALIDTGASVSSYSNNIIEAVSVIGEDAADDNGHGDRMVDFILSQDPEAEIISVKALGADGIGDVSAVIAAINYAIENKASIINLSAAAYATTENAALLDAVKKAVDAGVTFVGAAGNQGFNVKYYIPGNIAEALIVGAADETGAKIAASNFGETVDYNVVAKTTSEAAAKMTGFISANGAEAIEGALGEGLIYATDYVGGDASGEAFSGVAAQGEHTAGTWSELKELIEGTTEGPMTIKITKDLIAESPITVGKHITLESDDPAQPRTIYRQAGTANFSVFTVVKAKNDAKSLTLGNGIVMSGKQATYGKPEETTLSGDVTISFVDPSNNNTYYLRPNDYTNVTVNFSTSAGGNLSVWTIEQSGTSFKLKNKGTGSGSKYLYADLYRETATLSLNGSLFTVDANQHLVYSNSTTNYYLVREQETARFVAGDGTNFGTTVPFKVVTQGPATPIKNQKLYATNKDQGELFSDDQGFFVTVDGGKFYLQENAKLEGFNTVDDSDYAPKNVAPVLILSGAAELTGGSIENNRVSYTADDDKSKENAQTIKDYLKSTYESRTNSAGGMIITGTNSTVTITGNAIIKNNRGDVGGILLTDGATLNLGTQLDDATIPRGGSINDNIGFHFAGAVLVQNNAELNMEDGEMCNNITWNRGGAVWATEWGTNASPQKNIGAGVVENLGNKGTPGYFEMSGGKLEGNYAFMRGGAINVESNGVTLTGGEIVGNRCRVLGGGIYVEGDLPDYTYTLNIQQGYIGQNTAIMNVKDDDLDKILNDDGSFAASSSVTGGLGDSRDFNGAMGNGGGVWICPFGDSVFSLVQGYQVVLDENTKGSETGKDGTDFFIERPRGGGGVTVYNIGNGWVQDRGGQGLDFSEPRTFSGAFGMKNTGNTKLADYNGGGVKIYGNLSRDGGGIAANGTLLIGKPGNVYRFEGDMEITKAWPKAVSPTSASFRVEYTTDGGQNWQLMKSGSADQNNETDDTDYLDKEFTLDGEADDDGDDEDEGEYDSDHEYASHGRVWKYKMSLPNAVNVVGSDGKVRPFALYKFKYDGAVYDPTNPSAEEGSGGLGELYNKIRNVGTTNADGSKSLQVELVDWNIRVVETSASADGGVDNVVMNGTTLPTTATLTARNPIPKQRKNIDGEMITEYNIDFTLATIEQTFLNDLEPTVEKYINYKVHEDIEYTDEFRYDVMFYVPLDADKVEISDELVEILEFAKDTSKPYNIKDLSLKVLGTKGSGDSGDGKLDNNHLADNNGTVKNEADFNWNITLDGNTDYRLNVVKNETTNKITITLDSAVTIDKTNLFDGEEDGLGTIRGHWLRLTFSAKLKEYYQDPENLAKYLRGDGVMNGNTGVWETIADEDSIEGNYPNYLAGRRNDQNDVGGVITDAYNKNGKGPHAGIANNAKYVVNNKADMTYTSNTVTVKPAVYDISLRKTDSETGETMDNVTFTLKGTDGSTTKSKATASGIATFTGLKPGTYVIEESQVTGYKALNERIVVVVGNDGEATYAGVGNAIGVTADGQLTMNGQRLYVDAEAGQIREGNKVTTNETTYPLLLRASNGTDSITTLGHNGVYRIQVGNTGSDAYYLTHKAIDGEPTVEKNVMKSGENKLPVNQVRAEWVARDLNNNGYLFFENQRNNDKRFIYMDGDAFKMSSNKADVLTTSDLVSGADNEVDINVKNVSVLGEVKIKKTDAVTGEIIEGVPFELFESNGTSLGTQDTDTTGIATFTDLEEGKSYYITEKTAPTGYKAYAGKLSFSIDNKGAITIQGLAHAGVSTGGQLTLGGKPVYFVPGSNYNPEDVPDESLTTDGSREGATPLIVRKLNENNAVTNDTVTELTEGGKYVITATVGATTYYMQGRSRKGGSGSGGSFDPTRARMFAQNLASSRGDFRFTYCEKNGVMVLRSEGVTGEGVPATSLYLDGKELRLADKSAEDILISQNITVEINGNVIEITLPNAPELKIEKYVNKKVHEDIRADEIFLYDILAFVPNNASELVITDTLADTLEFVDLYGKGSTEADFRANYVVRNETGTKHPDTAPEIAPSVMLGFQPTNNHLAYGTDGYDGQMGTAATGIPNASQEVVGYGRTTDRVKNGKVVGTNGGENGYVEINGQTITIGLTKQSTLETYKGKWVHVRFMARIKEAYRSEVLEFVRSGELTQANADLAWDHITVDTPVTPRPEDMNHNGITNQAAYQVKFKGQNEFYPEEKSNIVTVKPSDNARLEITKVWNLSDENEEIPEAAAVRLKIKTAGGELVSDNVVLNWANNWHYTQRNLPTTDSEGNPIQYRVEEIEYTLDGENWTSISDPAALFNVAYEYPAATAEDSQALTVEGVLEQGNDPNQAATYTPGTKRDKPTSEVGKYYQITTSNGALTVSGSGNSYTLGFAPAANSSSSNTTWEYQLWKVTKYSRESVVLYNEKSGRYLSATFQNGLYLTSSYSNYSYFWTKGSSKALYSLAAYDAYGYSYYWNGYLNNYNNLTYSPGSSANVSFTPVTLEASKITTLAFQNNVVRMNHGDTAQISISNLSSYDGADSVEYSCGENSYIEVSSNGLITTKRAGGPVEVTVRAKKNGAVVATKTLAVYVGSAGTTTDFQAKVTNTAKNSKRNVTVEKTWAAGSQIPDGVKVKMWLYSDIAAKDAFSKVVVNGQELFVELSGSKWTHTFQDLPVYTDIDREIQYMVVEEAVTGYHAEYYTPEKRSDGSIYLKVENKPNSMKGEVEIVVKKEWKDGNGNDLPDSEKTAVTVQLESDYATANTYVRVDKPVAEGGIPGFTAGAERTLSADNNPAWTANWEGLPKYAADKKREVQYRIVEINAPDGIEWTASTPDNVNLSSTDGKSYIGTTERNPIMYNEALFARSIYNVTDAADSSKTEIAYCMNYLSADPVATVSGNALEYQRVAINSGSDLNKYFEVGKSSWLGYENTDTLQKRLLKIAYYGYPNDAEGIINTYNIKPDEFRHLTQYALWEYTDFYSSYYTNKATSSYGLTGNRNYQITQRLRSAYKKLMELVASNDFSMINDYQLYVYEPKKSSHLKEYQCLLGVETLKIRKEATVTNTRKDFELAIYKYGDGDKKVALKDVEFDLYVEDAKGTGVTVGDVTFKGAKLNTTPLKTNDKGYFKTGKILHVGRTYYLVETKAKNGYFLLNKPVKFKIAESGAHVVEWNGSATDPFLISSDVATLQDLGELHSAQFDENGNLVGVLEINNNPLYELPSTGGIGTYWFTIFGTVFLALAGVFVFNLISARRRRWHNR